MNEQHVAMLNELRAMGHAIVIFTPEEIANADCTADEIEDLLVETALNNWDLTDEQ